MTLGSPHRRDGFGSSRLTDIAFSARWVRSAWAQWLRFARAQWVRFVIDGSRFMASCYGATWLDLVQRLWPHFLTHLGSVSGVLGFDFWRGNNTLDHAPDTSTQRALVRAFAPDPPSTPALSRSQRRRPAGPDTSTQREQVRAFVPGPPLNAGAQPVTIRARSASKCVHSCQVRPSTPAPSRSRFSARWVRSARVQWVPFAVAFSRLMASCSGEPRLDFAQRLWHQFLTSLGITF